MDLQLVRPRSATRLSLVEPLDELNELGPALIFEGLLVGEDGLEDGQELRSQLADSGVLPFVWSSQHTSSMKSYTERHLHIWQIIRNKGSFSS